MNVKIFGDNSAIKIMILVNSVNENPFKAADIVKGGSSSSSVDILACISENINDEELIQADGYSSYSRIIYFKVSLGISLFGTHDTNLYNFTM